MEPDTSIAVKLWDCEALTDPQANNWVGNFHVRSEAVRRPVPASLPATRARASAVRGSYASRTVSAPGFETSFTPTGAAELRSTVEA